MNESPTIPEPSSIAGAAMEDGAIIRLRRHGNPAGPRLVLSHGNGLAIDGYYAFWSRLLDRYDLILFDFRNHGQNPLHGASGHHWPNLVSDLERIWRVIAEEWGERPTAGIFHSLSAVSSVRHTLDKGPRWNPLVLFDPPFPPPPDHPLYAAQTAGEDGIAARARRRTERFKDPSELEETFRTRPPFALWQPESCHLMARATLRRDDHAGDWVLACPRDLEAHIFETNRDPNLWRRIRNIPVPFKLIGGDPDHEFRQAPAELSRALHNEIGCEYEAIPHTTHFLQLERPDECIRAMESFLREQRFIQ